MKLTDTQRAILAAAAEHPEHLAYPPARLPAGARQTVARALLKQDLVIGFHRPGYDAIAKWTVDGDEMLLKITDDGLRAIGLDPNSDDAAEEDEQSAAAIARRDPERQAASEAAATGADTAPAGEDAPAPQPAQAAPGPARRASLRDAAAGVLAAWDASPAQDATDNPISRAIEALRGTLAGKPPRPAREPGAPRKAREGTKQEAVLALLRRGEGATVAQICEATGWQQHTVRGFFAGLKKRQGITVEVLERVRQVGPDRQGAKGSYSIYRIADAG
jgi:hypothetical protein